jgi:hypothetical protein
MSKPSNYSKSDHLDDDESNKEEQQEEPRIQRNAPPSKIATPASAPTITGIMRKEESNGRFVFEFNGQAIYEWEQTLDEVTIYVAPPPFVKKGNQINCKISPGHLHLGLQGGSQAFLNEPTGGLVDSSESTWSLEEEDGQKLICIYLIKAHKGQQWNTALAGRHSSVALNPLAQEQVKKDLMLERFQEENPGFDFRGAEFNGEVPDPRTFMGGVKY